MKPVVKFHGGISYLSEGSPDFTVAQNRNLSKLLAFTASFLCLINRVPPEVCGMPYIFSNFSVLFFSIVGWLKVCLMHLRRPLTFATHRGRSMIINFWPCFWVSGKYIPCKSHLPLWRKYSDYSLSETVY